MAKAAKGNKLKIVKGDEVDPLDKFQDTKKTGRVDPSSNPLGDDVKDPKSKKKVVKKAQFSIEKVKIENDHHLNVGYGIIHPDGTHEHRPGVSHDHFMHPDLKACFLKFRIHLAILCRYIASKSVKSITNYSEDLVKEFRVSGVSIKQGEGVVITGSVPNEKKKPVILNTPFTLTDEDPKTAYRFIEDLNTCIDELVSETQQYLERTKVGEDPQGKLDLKEPEDSYSEEEL